MGDYQWLGFGNKLNFIEYIIRVLHISCSLLYVCLSLQSKHMTISMNVSQLMLIPCNTMSRLYLVGGNTFGCDVLFEQKLLRLLTDIYVMSNACKNMESSLNQMSIC